MHIYCASHKVGEIDTNLKIKGDFTWSEVISIQNAAIQLMKDSRLGAVTACDKLYTVCKHSWTEQSQRTFNKVKFNPVFQ